MSFQEALQILGGIGVIASITFACLQIRRSTITMRGGCNRPDLPHIWSLVSSCNGVEFRRFADKLFAEIAASNAAAPETPAVS